VVCREAQPKPLELVEHCRTQIASYKKPKYLAFIEALPRVASTNKVDKKALRAQALCCFAASKADESNTD
jgi:non-ribosomal peptide synthetase component E (peptide arylation enzyme)